jgi:Tfp pilus assembly protein PilN
MAVNLNLLPPELAVSKSLGKVLKTLRALGVISIVVFLVFAVGLGILFIISTISLSSLNNSISQHESQISAQEASEQQIIILKDRIAKISQAKSTPSALKTVTNFDTVLANLSPDSTISQFNADSSKVSVSMGFKSNSDLTAFLQAVTTSKFFKSVILSSFGYGPTQGYSVGISLSEQ